MDDWLTDRILTHVCHHAPTQYRHGYWINFGNSRRRKTQFQSLASCRIGSAREKLLRQFQCQAWGVSHRVSSVRRSFAAACRLSQLLQLRCKYLLHFCDSLRSASKCSICRSDRLPVRQTTCKQTRRGIIKGKCINLNESLAVFFTNFLVAGSASSLVCWLLCSALPSSPSAAERAVPLHVQSRIHLLLRLQQDVCMGEYTDAVLAQALERAAVAVATQQSREDSSRIKNV